jgi:lipoyl(octanoyl) transferase
MKLIHLKVMKLIFKQDYIDYKDAMSWFDVIKNYNKNSSCDVERIFILEHNNVYTAGKSINDTKQNLICNIPVVYTDRGGLWTWHGHGQIVVYFIYNLRKRKLFLSDFIEIVEKTVIELINNEIARITNKSVLDNIKIYADSKKRGFWATKKNNNIEDNLKLGFIGLRVLNGFVFHGISINYNNDLSFFNNIVPCGLEGVKITSIQNLIEGNDKNNSLDIEIFKKHIGNALFEKLDTLVGVK